MFGLKAGEIIICLVLLVVFFGPKRLPELGAGLGKAISNFKKSYREGSDDNNDPNQTPTQNNS